MTDNPISYDDLEHLLYKFERSKALQITIEGEEFRRLLMTAMRYHNEAFSFCAERDSADKVAANVKAELTAVREMVSRFLVAHRDTARSWLNAFVECGAVEIDFNYHPLYPFIKPKQP